jgi:phosphoglycerate dehydrogenase-like enzyme
MDELVARSDIITLHCPGGAENRHLIDAGVLARMKRGAVLINAARGELVEEAALVEALRSGHLMGAGLDVFEVEPLPAGHALAAFENVVLSPHTAASVFDNVERVARHAFGNMQRTVEGQPIPEADLVIAPRR